MFNPSFRSGLLGLACLIQILLTAQTPTFQKLYSDSTSISGQWAIETPQGYLIAGLSVTSNTGNNTDALLMLVDRQGEPIWQRRYGDTLYHEAFSCVTLANGGGFVALGESYINGTGLADCWLVRVDTAGQVIWQKTIGLYNRHDYPVGELLRTRDGYIFSGASGPSGVQSRESFIVRVDNNGEIKWAWSNQTQFNRAPGYRAQFILRDSLYLCGGGLGPAHWMKRDTATGEANIFSTFVGDNLEQLVAMRPSIYGGLVMAGRYFPQIPNSPFQSGAWIQYQPADAPVLWSKSYTIPGFENHYISLESANGSEHLALLNGVFGKSTLMKIDTGGHVLWAKTYAPDTSYGWLNRIMPTFDGGTLAVGGMSFDNSTRSNLWLLKTDGDGNIRGCCAQNQVVEVSDFPVPTPPDAFMKGENYFGTPQPSAAPVDTLLFQSSNYCGEPQPTLGSIVRFCPGDTVMFDGIGYTQPGQAFTTIPSVTGGCDTLGVVTLEFLPQPTTSDTILFAPGQSVVINGISYSQPGTVVDTIPSTTGGCDTLAFYVLDFKTSGTGTAQISELKIFPNPAAAGAVLTIGGTQFNSATFVLRDATGRALATHPLVGNQVFLGTTGLPAGLYQFEVFENGRLAERGKLAFGR